MAAEYDKKNDCFYVYNNFVHDGKEKWETLSPSSYKASADRNGYNDESFGWTIWGIDNPKQPQVKKPQHVTKATTGSKGKWIRTSK